MKTCFKCGKSGLSASGLLACPTCDIEPETQQWHTYCPKCGIEAAFGETPDECEANWNKMISGQANDPSSATGREQP